MLDVYFANKQFSSQILEICYKSGVKVVTIYAFSIENFKRSKYEVDALMDMAKVKLVQLAQHGDLLDRYGASIRILGQRDLLKADLLEAIDKAASMTRGNKEYVTRLFQVILRLTFVVPFSTFAFLTHRGTR